MDKNKVLLLSWALFPTPSASAILVKNLVEQFEGSEFVLVGENDSRVDTHQSAVGIDGVAFRSEYFKFSTGLPGFCPSFMVRRIKKMIRWVNVWRSIKKIERIIREEKCEAIFCVFPNEFYLFIAYILSKRMDLPLYTWFHNTYLDNRFGVPKWFAKWLQPRVFGHAAITYTMSEGMQAFYRRQYPGIRSKALVHCFEIPDLEYRPFSIESSRKLKFAYTGTFNASCSDATIRLCRYIIGQPNCELHIFSGQSRSDFEKFGICGERVRFRGSVVDDVFIQELQKLDIMLLPHGFSGGHADVEYKTIFPTRTIPLLYSNRPILPHTPDDVFLTDFLREHDCAQIVDVKDGAAIEEAIQTIVNDSGRRETIVKNAL